MTTQAERRWLRPGWIKTILDRWNRNLVTRRQLKKLDEHQLRDIGVDQYSARREVNKPFWQD